MAFTDDTTGGRVIREGLMPVKVTLTDTCHVGDLIGYDAVDSDKWERASANGKVPPELIAGEKCETSGDTITCYKMAYVGYASTTSATAGDTIYLADSAGQYIATPVGSWNFAVGQAISTTENFICPSSIPLTVYSGTGTSYAGFFRAELESGRTANTRFGGVEIQVKVIDGATVTSDIYGINVLLQFQDTDCEALVTSGMRIEDGCSTSCHPDSFILMVGGAVGPDHLLDLGGSLTPTGGAWSTAAVAPSGSGGFLKVRVAGLARYIPLNTSSGA